MEKLQTVRVNGRDYKRPTVPVVVICCDGSEPEYIDLARSRQIMPNLDRILENGENLLASSVIPSFTNPNNLSIVTGRPPSVHGISGNFFHDRESGSEVMMNDPKYLRSPTLFSGFQEAGWSVAVITAKDKLRRLLGHGLSFDQGTAVCFSSERAGDCTLAENGIEGVLELVGMPVPEVYSLGLSEFVFSAGCRVLESMRPDVMYLSTTDYIQHKHAPGTEGANEFYRMMDGYLGTLHESGAIIVLTADHGMKAKHNADGSPDVVYLQDVLDKWLGRDAAKVILPITDPYVVHHGALGSFATVYLPEGSDVDTIIKRIASLPGIDVVLDRKEGCARFELPEDRLGDLIIVSGGSKVIGTRETEHDLSTLNEPLRSHGGLDEQIVPMIINRPVKEVPRPLRNFDAFHVGLNIAGKV